MNTLMVGAMLLGFQGQAPIKGDPELSFKLVETGTQSKLKTGGAFVLRTDQDYANYLKRRGLQSRRAPQVDFRKEQLVAIHVGDEPADGYSLRVVRIIRKNPLTTDVEVALDRPVSFSAAQVIRDPMSTSLGDPLPTKRKLGHPYVIVRTEKFKGNVRVRIVEPSDGKIDDR
jgi:hypothetical protein